MRWKVRKSHKVNGTQRFRPFDSFLEEEGIRDDVEAVAIKRVLAWQLEQAMKEPQKTKQRWQSSFTRAGRSWIDYLTRRMSPVTIATITRAARALGKRVVIRVTDAKTKRAYALEIAQEFTLANFHLFPAPITRCMSGGIAFGFSVAI